MSGTLPNHYSVKEAAAILGFSTNSIYKYCNEGRLKAVRGSKKQGRFRIPRSSLERFLGQPISDQHITNSLLEVHAEEIQQIQESAPITPTEAPQYKKGLPQNLIRGLILFSLLIIILDTIINQNYSLLQQGIRLTLLTIIILITYQYGDIRTHHESD